MLLLSCTRVIAAPCTTLIIEAQSNSTADWSSSSLLPSSVPSYDNHHHLHPHHPRHHHALSLRAIGHSTAFSFCRQDIHREVHSESLEEVLQDRTLDARGSRVSFRVHLLPQPKSVGDVHLGSSDQRWAWTRVWAWGRACLGSLKMRLSQCGVLLGVVFLLLQYLPTRYYY